MAMRIGVSTAAAGLLLGGLVAPSGPSLAAPLATPWSAAVPATAAGAADNAPAVRTRPVRVTPAGRAPGGTGPAAELTAQRTAPFRMVGVTWDPASTPPDVTVRVERAPGTEAQVDFGYAGYLLDEATGARRRAWAFVMTLAYSRHQYVEFVWVGLPLFHGQPIIGSWNLRR